MRRGLKMPSGAGEKPYEPLRAVDLGPHVHQGLNARKPLLAGDVQASRLYVQSLGLIQRPFKRPFN